LAEFPPESQTTTQVAFDSIDQPQRFYRVVRSP